MAEDKEIIKTAIQIYIRGCYGKYSDWYVGIASDPQDRLFNHHNVEKSGYYICEECTNSDIAREIEDYFVNTLGTDGGTGGGDDTTKFVYAYKKTVSTKE